MNLADAKIAKMDENDIGKEIVDAAIAVHREPDRDLVHIVENRVGQATVSKFEYANDALGRRTGREDTGSAFAAMAGQGQTRYAGSGTGPICMFLLYGFRPFRAGMFSGERGSQGVALGWRVVAPLARPDFQPEGL